MTAIDWLAWIGTGCWMVCFWWMHCISKRQQSVLDELREQAKRIESLSRKEHDLIKEVQPTVERIKDDLGGVAEAIHREER